MFYIYGLLLLTYKNQNNMKQRLLLVLAVFCLLATGQVWSQSKPINNDLRLTHAANDFTQGNGTPSNPYEVHTPNDLDNVRNFLSAEFILMNDIDLTEWIEENTDNDIKENGWKPIGKDATNSKTAFSGTFNGNGYQITGLWINRDKIDDVGLFGAVSQNGTIKQLQAVLADAGVAGNTYVGGLAGSCHGTISGCSVIGDGEVTGTSLTGGLTGHNNGTLSDCYSIVAASTTGANASVGGLVGYNKDGKITRCYAIGTVSETGTNTDIGGLVGNQSGGTITSCYYLYTPDYTGIGNVNDSENVCTSLTESQMRHTGSYTGWTFDGNPWMILGGQSAPYFKWQTDNLPLFIPKENYFTITLEIAAGIDLYSLTPGKLTVKEGDHLHLQFLPDDRTQTASDVMLLIDGVETTFKDFGSGQYFSYILNPVTQDHSILIALREYTVTLTPNFPSGSGAWFTPGAGQYQVPYGQPFAFALYYMPRPEQDDDLIKVYANGVELPQYDGSNWYEFDSLVKNYLRTDPGPEVDPSELYYMIDKVTGPIELTVEGFIATGNTDIAKGKIRIAVESGKLKVENSMAKAIDVAVYNLQGQPVAQCRVNAEATITLSPGIYVVQAGGQNWKVIIN